MTSPSGEAMKTRRLRHSLCDLNQAADFDWLPAKSGLFSMQNVEKMEEITGFYRHFLLAIWQERNDPLRKNEAEIKAALLSWLEEQKRSKRYRVHCKHEILSMYEEIENYGVKELERRINNLHKNCVYLLETS